MFLSHRVVRPDQSGYGRILGQAMFNSKRLYAAIVTLGLDHEDIVVAPAQRLPAEREHPHDEKALREQLRFIHDRIVVKSNEQILADPEAMKLLAEMGSDQIIIGYAFNARIDGKPNTSLDKANRLNRRIVEILNVAPAKAGAKGLVAPNDQPDVILSGSAFERELYKNHYLAPLLARLGVQDDPRIDAVDYLVSCTMDPWVTDTSEGDFIGKVLRPAVAAGVRKAIAEIFHK
ncbi:hypothetical protein [Embleya sp. NPDC020886]|uniref:hypothetical protein n=1 Tax=Embleya sp. NPDC020886 TaxID=3363980 RepID=UPI00379F8B7A